MTRESSRTRSIACLPVAFATCTASLLVTVPLSAQELSYVPDTQPIVGRLRRSDPEFQELVTLIPASRDDQFAQEFEALGQGALTRAVLGGAASGDDSEITVGELKSYVENAVPGLTEEHTGQAQYPTGFVFGQDFPVGVAGNR